eukprot:GHVL01007192.1.p1 GENE.GHVL01007192.1~~GHVL01007192.1.p1  ORF type:complete len:139 (+),score=21.92 GHVL01007192.1:164-580(+)
MVRDASFDGRVSRKENSVRSSLTGPQRLQECLSKLIDLQNNTTEPKTLAHAISSTFAAMERVPPHHVKNAIENLRDEECDELMKCVYLSWEILRSTILMFEFHSHLIQRCGIGLILRAISGLGSLRSTLVHINTDHIQ